MDIANDEADRLNSYLDAQARGDSADPDGLDPELVAMFEQVKTLHARATPDPTLKSTLWRTMMTTSQAAMPLSPGANQPSYERPTTRPARTGRRWTTFWRRPGRAFNVAATIALIVAVALGAFLVNRPASNPGPDVAQITAPGTPGMTPITASRMTPQATSTPCTSVYEGTGTLTRIAQSEFTSVAASNPSRPLASWQLQGWRVEPGVSARYVSPAPGYAVDFVLSGFYSATFGSTATVERHGEFGSSGEVIQPDSPVEITYGDTVSFDPAGGFQITNKSAVAVVFKRALFTVEPPSKAPLTSGAQVVVDSNGALPRPLEVTPGLPPTEVQLILVRALRNIPCDAGIRLGYPAGALTSDMAGYLLELDFAG